MTELEKKIAKSSLSASPVKTRMEDSEQFDVLELEMTLQRGYLEYRRQVVQLLAGSRPELSTARHLQDKYCEQAAWVKGGQRV